MDLLHKKCEVCGTKINKLQKILNIYALKAGDKLKCPKCGTLYKTYTIIEWIGSFYSVGLSILVLFLFVDIFWDFLENIFNTKLGIEVWIFTFIFLSLIEFLIMLVIPLEKIEL